MTNLFSKSTLSIFVLVLLTVFACKKDEDDTPTTGDDVVAAFQFEVDAVDPFTVAFTNFSSNATSYSWDFGDGNSSTDESPTHTYAAAGQYTVTLTASDGADEATRSETINITDPDSALALLAGASSKTWYLQREGIALGIGGEIDNTDWWAFGGPATQLGERPCILDDAYTFNRDGSWEKSTNGTIFVDSEGNGGWFTDEACANEADAGALTGLNGEDLSAFADGGSYTFDYNTATSTITIDGLGAYIGLPNKTEAGDNYVPISTKSYEVFGLIQGDVADSLKIAIVGADFVWNFYLVSYHDINDLPDIPDVMDTGTDLPNETPDQLFNTFASTDAADVQNLVPTESSVVLTPGVADPAGGATGVGEYIRGDSDAFSDLKFQLDFDCQFDNFTSMSVDVYFPSTNDYSGDLSQQVDIFLADASEDAQFWTTWENYQDMDQTATDMWVTVTFNLDNALTRDDLDLIGLKIGGENHTVDGTFYVRNFTFQ